MGGASCRDRLLAMCPHIFVNYFIPSSQLLQGAGVFISLFTGVDYGLRGGFKEPSHTVRMQVVCDFCSLLLGDVSVRVKDTWGTAGLLLGSDTCLSLTCRARAPHPVHTPLWTLVQVQNQAHYRSAVGPKVSPAPY